MTAASERAARQALDEFFIAWNAADIAAVRTTLNYPHVTFGPSGQLAVAQTSDAFETDFARLREREGWHHSTIDSFTAVSASDAKVHCEVEYSRYHADGTRYGGGRVLYIVTNHDGHWGMQFRSGLPETAG
jgi:hypothetical protein